MKVSFTIKNKSALIVKKLDTWLGLVDLRKQIENKLGGNQLSVLNVVSMVTSPNFVSSKNERKILLARAESLVKKILVLELILRTEI